MVTQGWAEETEIRYNRYNDMYTDMMQIMVSSTTTRYDTFIHSSKKFQLVCICVCVCARARVCVCMCGGGWVRYMAK